MKRRDLLKSCLVAPFVGLFKKKEYSCSSGSVQCGVMTNSAEPSSSSDSEKPHQLSMHSRPKHPLGACLVLSCGERYRYVKMLTGTEFYGHKTTRPIWLWIPENLWIYDNSGNYVKR